MFRRLAHAGNLLRHPARDHAVVVGGREKSFSCESFAQRERRASAIGFHISNEVRELARRRDDGDESVVLGSGADHGGPTDVNVFYTNVERLAASRHRFEGVEVGHLQDI